MTVYLSLEELIALCTDLGVGPVRDLGLLDAAAYRPRHPAPRNMLVAWFHPPRGLPVVVTA